MGAVLEVTDSTVRLLRGGTGREPSRALVESALDWIDDPVGLLDERPVAVADLWRSLVLTLLGSRCASAVVVYPPDWTRSRLDRVLAAVNTVVDRIEAVSSDRWAENEPTAPASADTERPGRRVARLLAVGVLAGVAVVIGVGVSRPGGTTVVEGRMAVRIPADWHLKRVTGGPGSRRLQVTPPDDPGIAMHLTSSYAPEATLADTAAALARAIAAETPGVFGELRADVTVAGRAAVTYRENRPGRVIAWTVVQDGSTRISIGCQSPPGRESDVRAACDDVVGSAREK